MSPLDDRFLVAFGGLVIVIVWLFGIGLTFYDDDNANEQQDASDLKRQPAAEPTAETTDPNPIVAKPNPREHHQYEADSDTLFKRRQINIGKGLNVLTGLAAIAGIFGLYVLYGTLSVTKNAVEVANRQANAALTQAENQLRALDETRNEFAIQQQAEIEPDASLVSFVNKNGINWAILHLRNTGHSTADSVHVQATVLQGNGKKEIPPLPSADEKKHFHIRVPAGAPYDYAIFLGKEVATQEFMFGVRVTFSDKLTGEQCRGFEIEFDRFSSPFPHLGSPDGDYCDGGSHYIGQADWSGSLKYGEKLIIPIPDLFNPEKWHKEQPDKH